MFDLMRSYSSDQKERPVMAGATIGEEGSCYIYVSDTAGARAVQMCAGANGELIAGFGVCDAKKVTTETVVETITVPAAGGAVFLKYTNIVASSERVYDNDDAALMTQNAPPGNGQYDLVDSTGSITFNVADANHSISVIYRYNLTMAQIVAKYHERSINNRAQDYFSSISLACGDGEIFTSMYDTATAATAYTINAPLYAAAGGLISCVQAGAVATLVGYVSSLPTADNSLLGVKYLIG